MSAKTGSELLAERLEAEIRAIDKKIAQHQAERQALVFILERTRSEAFSAVGTARKSSFGKAVVEQEILLVLRRRAGPVSNADLLAAARTVKYNLMPATFRTHLHRLKTRGLIKNDTAAGRGYWVLAKPNDRAT